jgi:hypothetical protein
VESKLHDYDKTSLPCETSSISASTSLLSDFSLAILANSEGFFSFFLSSRCCSTFCTNFCSVIFYDNKSTIPIFFACDLFLLKFFSLEVLFHDCLTMTLQKIHQLKNHHHHSSS